MRSEALIVAQSDCEEWEKLPRAAGVARQLAERLNSNGCVVTRWDLLNGSDKHSAEQALENWLRSAQRDARMILFWTGHGGSEGAHYLVCRNSPRAGLTAFNAIDAGNLGPAIANCRAEKILLILDTCYSGQGAAEIAAAFSRVLAIRSPMPGQERSIAVIASAHPLEKAREGTFCNALLSVLFDAKTPRLWSEEDEYIHSEFLARAIGKVLPSDVSRPQYKADGVGQDFIPNPRYRPGLVAEIVEERAWRLSRSVADEHFDLAARGIEVGTSGWYFTGRSRLLTELIAWLKNAHHGVRIVTGPPGSGKSAVMGRLATLSDKYYRKAALNAGVLHLNGDETVAPEGLFDVAIHAKGRTLDDCARTIARALDLPIGNEFTIEIEALVSAIGKLGRRVTIMIDGLDEAASGQGRIIALRLIVPLGRLANARILAGIRRSFDGQVISAGEQRHKRLRDVFGFHALIDDLEDEPETHKDIAEYVRRRLAASLKHGNDPVGIEVASARVADRAGGVFLYARIVSRTLQELAQLDGALPKTALEAFEDDLRARFGAEQQRVDDLLAALAWGEGKGLTRRVWTRVANAFASHFYDDNDVQWVLDHAGWHIIETGEDGQAVYRLGHQALADNYRSRHELRKSQERIVAALMEEVSGVEWLDTDRYLWRHLAVHAEAAGRLQDLIKDVGYLAVADPIRLAPLLLSIQEPDGARFADIYNRVVDRLIEQAPLMRFGLIHLTAQMEAPQLAEVLEPPTIAKWRCQWARVRPSAPYRIVARQEVTAVVFGKRDGGTVVVSGTHDGIVWLWDARTGQPVLPPLAGHTKPITSLAFGEVDGCPVVVSGSADWTARLWNARTGEPIGRPLTGHGDVVTSVAFGNIDGRAVVVSGGNNTIRLWNGRNGEPIGILRMGHTSQVTSVAVGDVEGYPFIVSGGRDEAVRLWDASTGNLLDPPLVGHTSKITSVAVGEFDGRSLIVSGSSDETIGLWDTRTRQSFRRPLKGHTDSITSVACGIVDFRTVVVVSGSRDDTIRLWNAQTGKLIGQPLEGHSDSVISVALGEVSGRTTIVSASNDRTVRLWDSRAWETANAPFERHLGTIISVALAKLDSGVPVVASSYENNVRLWDARTGKPICRSIVGHTDSISTVAHVKICGRAVVVSGSHDKTVRLWDAHTGEPIGRPMEGHTDWVTSVAVGEIDGRVTVVSGSHDHTIRLWDAQTGEPIGRTLEGHADWVTSVALGDVEGRATIVSASHDGTIRLWDGRTGEQICLPLKGHSNWITSIALGEVDGRAVIVSGSFDKSVRLWDACAGEPIGRPLEGEMGRITSVALGQIDDRPVVVCGSYQGVVQLWDVRTGEQVGRPLIEHTDQVTSVALGEIAGGAVVMSGSKDGTVRLYDARSRESIGWPIKGHAEWVTSIALGDVDGRAVVVSGSDDKTVRLWDAQTGEPIGRPLKHTERVKSVAIGEADGQAVVATGCDDGFVFLWDVRSGEPIGRLARERPAYRVSSIKLGMIDGRAVVVLGSHDGNVRLWDARTREPLGRSLKGHTLKVTSLSLGEVEGRPVIVSGSICGTVQLWDVRARQRFGHAIQTQTRITAVGLGHVDGYAAVVSGSEDGTVQLWDARNRGPIGRPFVGHADRVTSVALSMVDGRAVIVSAGYDGIVRMCDAITRQEHFAIDLSAVVTSMAFVPNVGVVISVPRGLLCIKLREASK